MVKQIIIAVLTIPVLSYMVFAGVVHVTHEREQGRLYAERERARTEDEQRAAQVFENEIVRIQGESPVLVTSASSTEEDPRETRDMHTTDTPSEATRAAEREAMLAEERRRALEAQAQADALAKAKALADQLKIAQTQQTTQTNSTKTTNTTNTTVTQSTRTSSAS